MSSSGDVDATTILTGLAKLAEAAGPAIDAARELGRSVDGALKRSAVPPITLADARRQQVRHNGGDVPACAATAVRDDVAADGVPAGLRHALRRYFGVALPAPDETVVLALVRGERRRELLSLSVNAATGIDELGRAVCAAIQEAIRSEDESDAAAGADGTPVPMDFTLFIARGRAAPMTTCPDDLPIWTWWCSPCFLRRTSTRERA